MKVVFSDDVFFHNFRYLKRKNRISCRMLARLLGVRVEQVKQIEGAPGWFAIEYRIVERTAQIFGMDQDVLMTVDLANPVCSPCGPQQEKT